MLSLTLLPTEKKLEEEKEQIEREERERARIEKEERGTVRLTSYEFIQTCMEIKLTNTPCNLFYVIIFECLLAIDELN